MNTTIRSYEPKDLEELLSAWESASKLAHPFLTREFLEQEKYNIPNLYLPNADTWVAIKDNTVVGFIALIGNEVGAIFVDPEYQGNGLGGALMDKAKSLHAILELEVFYDNSIGRGFYEHYGFQTLEEKTHEATGNKILRLRFSVNK